jgi:diguanylate cyclase (GGDEF)-like protein/PAS domain S-box-containing protein
MTTRANTDIPIMSAQQAGVSCPGSELESERLAALHSLGLLDTRPSESIDRITALAAYVLDVPIALVSLIDADRQWFMSRVGIEVTETPRGVSFCTHAVSERKLLEIADATQDPRFAALPMVRGAPHIRAYLGMPLFSRAGHALGTLCAIDVRPRNFAAADTTALTQLAKILEDSLHARELAAATDSVLKLAQDAQQRLVESRDTLQAEVTRQTQRLRSKNGELQTHIRRLLHSERSLRVVEHRLRSITNNVPVMIGYWNSDLQCEFANNAYQELFRLQPKWTIGTSMRALLGDGHFSSIEPLAHLALAGEPQHFVRRNVRADGSAAFVEVRFIPDFDEASRVRGFFVLAGDVTEARNARVALEATNEKLARESATDYLTGLSNRRVFSERSEIALQRFHDAGEVYGLILMDLDDFKRVNDVHGHDVGDDVLRAVGAVLRDQLRCDRDIAARLGGEEFAILCFGDLDRHSLGIIAERVREQVAATGVTIPQGLLEFTGSFGIAICNASDSGWKNIYARADAALYEAKASGKNRVQFGKSVTPAATGRFRTLPDAEDRGGALNRTYAGAHTPARCRDSTPAAHSSR